MFKITVTCLVFGLFIAISIAMALDRFFDPVDWVAAAGVFGTINTMIILILLIQRAVWRSSPGVLRNLYWPGVASASLLGLSGIATILNAGGMDSYLLRVGGYIVLISVLAGFSLWRSRRPTSMDRG